MNKWMGYELRECKDRRKVRGEVLCHGRCGDYEFFIVKEEKNGRDNVRVL